MTQQHPPDLVYSACNAAESGCFCFGLLLLSAGMSCLTLGLGFEGENENVKGTALNFAGVLLVHLAHTLACLVEACSSLACTAASITNV